MSYRQEDNGPNDCEAQGNDRIQPVGGGIGHEVSFKRLRDPSTLQAVRATLQTWSTFDSGDTPSSPVLDAPDGKIDESPVPPKARKGKIIWSKWDELDYSDRSLPMRVLLIAYASSAFVIWDCTSLDAWHEILNIPALDACIKQHSSARELTNCLGLIKSAAILPPMAGANTEQSYGDARPLLAILMSGDASTSCVVFYSLRKHVVVHIQRVNGIAHRLAVSPRTFIISTTAPLALHLFSAVNLEPLHTSRLDDLIPSPIDSSPVFDLGRGGRLLAYATAESAPFPRYNNLEIAMPGAGLLSQKGFFEQDDAEIYKNGLIGTGRTAGQMGGQVARKVSEGVFNGVMAIGGMGYNYWTTRSSAVEPSGSPTKAEECVESTVSQYSKSAPLPPSTNHFVREENSGAILSSPASTSSMGTIIVVDLQSFIKRPRAKSPTFSAVAHFRPYSCPISLLSLSPSSSLLLSAPSHGLSFDVFEMKPSVKIGVSSTGNIAEQYNSPSGKVWHRYRLTRGFTNAETTSATWSPDSRLLAICTGKGTTHMFGLQPFGGRPEFESHFAAKVTNAKDLQPLSVSIGTIARIRLRDRNDSDDNDSWRSVAPAVSFLQKLDSMKSTLKPGDVRPLVLNGSKHNLQSARNLSLNTSSFQDCLIFNPQSETATLERLSVNPAPTAAESTIAAAARGDVGQIASTAVSGLSQLMRSRGTTSITSKKDWVVSCSRKAEWSVVREADWGMVQEPPPSDSGMNIKQPFDRPSAEIEIETYSRSPNVLPRSLYRSQQFRFFTLPKDHKISATTTQVAGSLRRLPLRSEVHIRQGPPGADESLQQSPPSNSSEAACFDQPIKSAMQTVLDHEALLTPWSANALAPTFPNGVAGKQGGRWRDAMPIRVVAPTVNEGLGRFRRELGRVRSRASESKRRASSSGAFPEPCSSSVSFEDDDAVLADLDRINSESGSTACTSEQDIECDDAWGLDDHEEQPGTKVVTTTTDRKAEHATGSDVPFDEDYDDSDF